MEGHKGPNKTGTARQSVTAGRAPGTPVFVGQRKRGTVRIDVILNTSQRRKAEVFPDYLFVVLKMMSWNENSKTVDVEHVSLILGDNYVISFLETEGDVFDEVRERIRSAKGRIRTMKADYLAYGRRCSGDPPSQTRYPRIEKGSMADA